VEKLGFIVNVMKGFGRIGPGTASVSERESLGLEEYIESFMENLCLACGSQDKAGTMKRLMLKC
jgi:hypothetical protein